MNLIRSDSIYVTANTRRWLKMIAKVRDTTADALADEILRAGILATYPNIETVNDEYWKTRSKAHDEAIEKLKPLTPRKEG